MLTHTVVYPGTFDPITNGHIDLVERAAKLSSESWWPLLPVRKSTAFSHRSRVELAKACLNTYPPPRSCPLTGCSLTSSPHRTPTVCSGSACRRDFEYEFQLANMNRAMDPEFESVF